MVLLQVGLAVHAGRNKLSVVNQTILVTVDNLHSLFHVFNVQLNLWNIFHTCCQLVNGKLTVAILINFGENLPEQRDLVFRNTSRNQAQSCAL